MNNNLDVSSENASLRLRRRINGFGFRHLGSAVWLSWLLAKLLVKAFILFVLEALLLGGSLAFVAAFLAGNALLILKSIADIRRKFWKRRGKNEILIGKSFRHFTESAGRVKDPMEVGSDSHHYVDYVSQPNPHVLMLGSTSSGKTTTMRSFISRVSLRNGIRFLIIDWNGENEEWARSVNATVWKVPMHFKVNLFRLNGMTKESRASSAIESLAISAHLTALQSTKVKSALLRFYAEGREPSLLELWNALCYRNASKANVLDQRLRAIQRVIGYEPDEFWEGVFERNSVVSLMGLNESEKSLVAYAILQRLTELFDKNPWNGKGPRLMVVIDEAWQLLRKEKEYGAAKESVAERIVRLGRKYGIGIIISTQQLDDVPKAFINSSSLLMIHQHREASYFGRDILQLNSFEREYMRNAAQGEMLLFDRGRMQSGDLYPGYVKVEPMNSNDVQSLASMAEAYMPNTIDEPEMPIEMQDAGRAYEDKGKKEDILEGVDLPSVVVYRFLVALARTKKLKEAYKLLKAKGWATSDTTLYGNRSKPSLLSRAMASGYVSDSHELTRKALAIIDPGMIIEKQGIYAGSEEHKELMRKTIMMVQDKGSYAFTISGKESFDIGELKAKTKGVWDLKSLRIYECQTNSIKEEIEKGVKRSRTHNAFLVWVANSSETIEQIRSLTGNANEYIVLA